MYILEGTPVYTGLLQACSIFTKLVLAIPSHFLAVDRIYGFLLISGLKSIRRSKPH